MRLRNTAFVGTSSAVAAGVVAFALALVAPPASGADSKGDFTPMRFMLGTWTCSGKALDGSTFSLTQITTLNGDQMLTRDSQNKSITTLYWDSSKHAWVQTSESANGSSAQTSSGWSGASLVFTGTITIAGAPGAVGYRSTTTKVSDTQTQQLDELAKPDGSWLTFDTGVCNKKS